MRRRRLGWAASVVVAVVMLSQSITPLATGTPRPPLTAAWATSPSGDRGPQGSGPGHAGERARVVGAAQAPILSELAQTAATGVHALNVVDAAAATVSRAMPPA